MGSGHSCVRPFMFGLSWVGGVMGCPSGRGPSMVSAFFHGSGLSWVAARLSVTIATV